MDRRVLLPSTPQQLTRGREWTLAVGSSSPRELRAVGAAPNVSVIGPVPAQIFDSPFALLR